MGAKLPHLYGSRVISGRRFLVLEDVSCGGHNVMDVKIGAVTWDHLASEQKIASEKAKYPFGMQLGFRILGYRVRDSRASGLLATMIVLRPTSVSCFR